MDEPPVTRLPVFVDDFVLRRIGPTDVHDLLEYWSDPQVVQYQFWGPLTCENIVALIDSQRSVMAGDPGVAFVLAVELDHKVIGDCQLTVTRVDDRQAEIGFAFHPRFLGRGIASRAVASAIGFGFVQLGLHRIVAATDVRNERSWRLMERLGMRREAHFIHETFAKGQWVDAFVYAILDEEWKQLHSELLPYLVLDHS